MVPSSSHISGMISVIVPVYNSKPYLKACIESIVSQDFPQFEILLIDDGSNDGSESICDEFGEKYSTVRVFHQINSGATFARWKGVQEALGEWITFVDSDDSLPKEALKSLYSQSAGTEIVYGNPNIEKQNASLEDIKKWIIEGKVISSSPCSKLFKWTLFDKFIFDIPRSIKVGEDLLMNIRLIFKTQLTPHFVTGPLYIYNCNLSSVTHTFHRTLDYEYYFAQYLIKSIPKNELQLYYEEIVKVQLNGIIGIAWDNPAEVAYNKTHPVFKLIRENLRKSNYKMNLVERIIFKSPIILPIRMAIVGLKIQYHFKR